jgi:hypothetical protein
MANDYDADHLITFVCSYIYPKNIDYKPYARECTPEVLTRADLLKQILIDEIPFHVLGLDEQGKVYYVRILVYPYENDKLYIKPRNDITNYMPCDYLRHTSSITEWVGDGSDKTGQDFINNPLLDSILNRKTA